MNKIIWPVTLIISSLIIGGGICGGQYIKQESAERQQKLDLEQREVELQLEEKKLEQAKQEKEQIQQRSDVSIQMRNQELRSTFISDCQKERQEVLDMLSGRMNHLGCFDSMDLCYEDYSYNLYMGWLDGERDIETCLDRKIQLTE